MLYYFVEYYNYVNLAYFFVINSFFLLLILLAFPAILERFNQLKIEDMNQLLKSQSLPPISIVVPLFNEEATIVESVHSLLRLEYPNFEIIIANDGSTDRTMKLLKREFKLVEVPKMTADHIETSKVKSFYRSEIAANLYVLDKENGLRADALNAGLNICQNPLFLSIDADTLIESDALLRMIRPFLTSTSIIAEGGTIRLLNGCDYQGGRVKKIGIPTEYWAGIQVGEYLRAFLYGRLGWNLLGGTLSVSGAFGLFDRTAALAVGGYNNNTLAEDLEMTVDLIRYQKDRGVKGAASVFVPDPVAWTEGPKTAGTLGRQRDRWHQGLLQAIFKYKGMLFNPKYGFAGMLGVPNLVFAEAFQPIMEFCGYFALIAGLILGTVDWYFVFLFLVVSWGISAFLTLMAIVMEITTFHRYSFTKDVWYLVMFAFLENFGYRQAYFWWKIRGMWKYFRGSKGWSRAK
ncbi:MAG: hypothetical protein SP1CHLAM54_08140 [Chlamydiia bacterium]|nr:hypothetical protein [Chlamydiia bacterium]MCH9615720.1 hypothetical protein [Chlamydiia bacterium]MCH9628877.1 hypothetical protein [Chlamydiia bacterium]